MKVVRWWSEEDSGHMKRNELYRPLGILFLVLAQAGFFGLLLRDRSQALGEEIQPRIPLLTVHGPNDGEPLNNSIELKVNVATRSYAYVVVYCGTWYVTMAPVIPKEGQEIQCVAVTVDSTRFPNGRLNLTFCLFNERLTTLYGATTWSTRIENPILITGQRNGNLLKVQIRGRPGDLGYTLLASQEGTDLLVPPDGRPRSPRVKALATGQYSGRLWDGTPYAEVVLNLDDLVKVHTLNGAILAWSFDSQSYWSRSRQILIVTLLNF